MDFNNILAFLHLPLNRMEHAFYYSYYINMIATPVNAKCANCNGGTFDELF